MSETTALRYEPGLFSWELRSTFVYWLIQSPSYEPKIRGIKGQWEQMMGQYPELSQAREFRDLPASEDPEDELNRYIFGVRKVVGEGFRCRSHGVPADWLCQAVHAACRGGDMALPINTGDVLRVFDLRVVVSSMGWAAVRGTLNGVVLGQLEVIEDDVRSPFKSWKKLKKLVFRVTEGGLGSQKEALELVTSEWPLRYEKGVKTRMVETMPKLVEWLVGDQEMFRGDQSATNRLLHELDLDPPGPTQKSDRIR